MSGQRNEIQCFQSGHIAGRYAIVDPAGGYAGSRVRAVQGQFAKIPGVVRYAESNKRSYIHIELLETANN